MKEQEILCKVLSFNDETVTLECLVENEYEEREFTASPFFDDFVMYRGKYLKMIVTNGQNSMTIKMEEVDLLWMEGSFLSSDFYGKFKDIKLKK